MRQAALVLAASLVLAGCVLVEEPGREGADGDPPAAAPARLVYGDCDELLGAFPVQEDAVALPEGFAPAPFLGQGNGNVFIVAWSCATATAEESATETAPFVEAIVGFAVTPPPELALAGAFAHALLLGLSTGSPLGLATYGAWSVPAASETLAFEWTDVGEAGALRASGTGALRGAVGSLDVDLRVSAAGPAADAASAVRMFVAEGRELVAAYDIAWVEADGMQGQAISGAPLPGAPPATSGLGFFYASDAPDRYTMTPYPLVSAGSERVD